LKLQSLKLLKWNTFCVGGGLSSSYVSSEEPDSSSYSLYRSELEATVPELFSGKYRLITEFGRSLLLKAGISLSKVEYVKNWLDDVRFVKTSYCFI